MSFNFFSVIFFLLAGFLSAQIPINSFCKFDTYNVHEGLTNLCALNFNNDSYSDLLIFGSESKAILALKGEVSSGFGITNISKTGIEISRVQPAGKKSSFPQLYFFTSRKTRTAGILGLSASGTVSIRKKIKLDSYPGNLSVADINNDGSGEAILSGSSFYGLSILNFTNGILKEKRLFYRQVFSQAIFVDLNNDSYPDIAAVDLFGSTMKFFYNNSRGEFYQAREITLKEKITILSSYDFNSDGYQDLIYVQGCKIRFLFGDGRAAFNDTYSLNTNLPAVSLAFSDFNRDGINDIAYINSASSVLSVIFSRAHNSFFPEEQYLQKAALTDLIPFYSKFVNGLMALSSKGKLYLVSNLRIIKDDTRMVFGTRPSAISYFDAGNDRIIDLCYFDKAKPSLDLVLRNNSGIPSMFYSIPVLDSCSNLQIDNISDYVKTFYCYSKGTKLIETVTVDFLSGEIKKDKIYSYEPIEDIKIRHDENSGVPQIFILTVKEGIMKIFVCSYSNFRYNFSASGTLASDVRMAKLSPDDPYSIFFWKKEKRAINFSNALVGKDLSLQSISTKYVIPFESSRYIVNVIGDVFNKDRNELVNFIFNKRNKYALISSGKGCMKLNLKGELSRLNILSDTHIYCGENNFNGLNKIFVYDRKNELFEIVDIISKQRTLLGRKLVESKNLDSYFVKNMNFSKNHLVYTDKAENCITIKEINF